MGTKDRPKIEVYGSYVVKIGKRVVMKGAQTFDVSHMGKLKGGIYVERDGNQVTVIKEVTL